MEESLEHLITAYDENYITEELLKDLQVDQEQCLKLLNGYSQEKTKKVNPKPS